MRDELFEPGVRHLPSTGGRPWRQGTVAVLTVFGGVLAGTVLSCLNARRLGVDRDGRRAILLLGVAGLVALVPLVMLAVTTTRPSDQAMWLVCRLLALCVHAQQARVQHRLARDFRMRGGEYGMLLVPGFFAALLCSTVDSAVIGTALRAVR